MEIIVSAGAASGLIQGTVGVWNKNIRCSKHAVSRVDAALRMIDYHEIFAVVKVYHS